LTHIRDHAATKNVSRKIGPRQATKPGREQLHPIRLAAKSRIVSHSAGLGWRNAHASITSDRVWEGRLPAIEHLAIAYCMRRTNTVERRIDGERAAKTVAFGPRQFGLMPTHVASTYGVKGGADVLLVYLRASMIRRVASEMFGGRVERVAFQTPMGFLDPLLEQIAQGFIGALDRQDPVADPRYVDELARMAAAHLLRHYVVREEVPEPAPAPMLPELNAGIQRVRGFIDDCLDCDLSLEVLAREAQSSPVQFTKAFTQTQRVTPHQYIIKRRVEQAGRLLTGTSLPLAEIALQTGFASQSHFSDVFKRVTGETPRAFRHAR
jgi:AraC family transcriptional regulator